MCGSANVCCPYFIGLRGLLYRRCQPHHWWMRVLRNVVVICRILHSVCRNNLHRGICGLGNQLLRRLIHLLDPHHLRRVRRADGLLLLRRNGRLWHLPAQFERVRVPQDAFYVRGRLLELRIVLILQFMLHLCISVPVRVLRDECDKRQLHGLQWRHLPRRLHGRRVIVMLHRRRSLRRLLWLRGLQCRSGLRLLRHVHNERLVQVGQLHFEQLFCAQRGRVNRGGLRQPGHVRLLHVFGLRKVR